MSRSLLHRSNAEYPARRAEAWPNGALLLSGHSAHILGALLALVYNLMIRSALKQEPAEAVMLVTRWYVLGTTVVGGAIGAVLVRRLQSYAGKVDESVKSRVMLRRYVLWFPLGRALVSSACWLTSIPLLAAVSIHANGRVNPLGFPHFVASILIAWLVSTTYSSVSNLWLALRLSRAALAAEAHPDAAAVKAWTKTLCRFVRVLPRLALAVPLIAATMYLVFFEPLRLGAGAGKPLEFFLVALMMISGYGWYFCRRAAFRMAAMLGE